MSCCEHENEAFTWRVRALHWKAEKEQAESENATLRENRFLERIAAYTPCSCSAQRARAERAEAEVERLHSWDGLLELLDEHWPEDTFPTLPDDQSRDPGPRIVSLIRWVAELRARLDRVFTAHSPGYGTTCTTCRALLGEDQS